MDLADEAQSLTDLEISIALKNRVKPSQNVGICHSPFCEKPINKGLYCDAYCRDDYEIERKKMRCENG